MKKQTKIIIGIVAIVAVVAIVVAVIMINQKPKTNLEPITSAEDLSALIEKVYEGQAQVLSSLATQTVDVSDNDYVSMVTGLENGEDFEYIAVSEPMISSQAYSFVLAKVKEGVDADSVAKEMSEKIDPRKWICVTAEKIYATSSGDVVCLVMSSEEMAKPVYDKFKELAGSIGQEYEKTQEEASIEDLEELP